MDIEKPLVSVLMTAFNREQYIAEAIESVLASTYSNFELIIVDDCSTDKSYQIAAGYAASDKRIKLYRNEKNLGDYLNRNKAASHATGKYIKFIDSDDAIFDWGLAYCVDYMELYPDAALGTLCFKKGIMESCISSKEIIEEHFFNNELLNIGPSGTIFKTKHFKNIGFFSTRFGIASDMYVNIKLAAIHPVVLLPRVFFFYRRHDAQELKNSYFKYLVNNFLYQQQLVKEAILPLSQQKIQILEKRRKKGFAIDLLKSALKPNCWKKNYQAMKEVKFGFSDIVFSIIR